MVRYFGLYANAHRGKVRKTSLPLRIVEEEIRRLPAKGWAALIRKVYEADPMTCPKCGGRMEVIAFITDLRAVDRIIDHLKLTFTAQRPPPYAGGGQSAALFRAGPGGRDSHHLHGFSRPLPFPPGGGRRDRGAYREIDAARDHPAVIAHQGMDWFKELGYYDRKAVHNLKYFTWIEQQGKTSEELNAQWRPEYWEEMFTGEIDTFERLIANFNREVGL
jgi:hypothetical protein